MFTAYRSRNNRMDSWDIPLESDLGDTPPLSSVRSWFLHHNLPSLQTPPVSIVT